MTVQKLKMDPKLKVSVEISREWEGKKVADELVGKINAKVLNPKFILLFTTIHYKEEFKLILSGMKEAFPDAPLIGGTVAGFITQEGCYTRGVTAFALDYPNMDVAVGVGHNTKRNPKKAARDCAERILEGLKDSKYENKFLLNLISAPIIPELPLIGKVNNIKSKTLGRLVSYIGMPLVSYMGSGIAKEVDILDQLAVSMPEYYIIGGSSVDDGKMLSNYQFIENSISTNSVVAIGCTIDRPISLKKIIAIHETNEKFKITNTTFDDRIVTKIENKPAKEYFFKKVLGMSEEQFKNLGPFYYKTSDYLPITFEENRERVLGVGCFFGDDILLSHKSGGKHAILCSVTGKEVIDAIRSLFTVPDVKLPFLLAFSSAIFLFILGNKIFDVKKILDQIGEGMPYLMLQPMIENVRIPNQNPAVRAYSFNALSF